jgi:predicted nucleic acid-binding protein
MEVSSQHSPNYTGLFVAEESARYDEPRTAVYLDTTIVSYLTSKLSQHIWIARHQRITRVWWSRYRHRHMLWVSPIVTAESEAGNAASATARLDVIAGVKILPSDTASRRLAAKLVGGGLLPDKARADAAHIAIAAINSVPLLLTWNCKHLANPVIHRKIVRVCEAEGYCCPDICTPEYLMRTYTHAKSTHR